MEAGPGSVVEWKARSGFPYKKSGAFEDQNGPMEGRGRSKNGGWRVCRPVDIKFWKGNENLGSVYKKPFFEILIGFLPFLTF
jgi:hypothetical protein